MQELKAALNAAIAALVTPTTAASIWERLLQAVVVQPASHEPDGSRGIKHPDTIVHCVQELKAALNAAIAALVSPTTAASIWDRLLQAVVVQPALPIINQTEREASSNSLQLFVVCRSSRRR